MQPYFFPYLGYFDLINFVDKWIVFDNAQFSKGGWYNRNRILHPNSGWQYITIPLASYSMGTQIIDIEVHQSINWKSRLMGQLMHYQDRKAPFYAPVAELVQDCLNFKENGLSPLNVYCLLRVCKHIGIEMNYTTLSELNYKKIDNETAANFILRI